MGKPRRRVVWMGVEQQTELPDGVTTMSRDCTQLMTKSVIAAHCGQDREKT